VAPNAVKEVVSDAAARYERASGNRTLITWSGSEAIAKRVGDGEVFDVVLNTPQNLDTLATAGKIVPGTRVDFAKSGIGVAVRAGQPRPDVSNEEALRKALLEAKSIGISSGPSGRYWPNCFSGWASLIRFRARSDSPLQGAQIAELLSRGEVELGLSADPLNYSTPVESTISVPYPPGFRATRSGQEACTRRKRRGGEPHIPEHARVVGRGDRDPKGWHGPDVAQRGTARERASGVLIELICRASAFQFRYGRFRSLVPIPTTAAYGS
jgi:hypothetical protein